MDASPPAASDRIYISYRREETRRYARYLHERLAGHYGDHRVVMEVDAISPGEDLVEAIASAVASSNVLLVLIGNEWLTITDPDGRRRLDDPGDVVRLEIEAALTRNVPIIPILVDEARMPRADELPPSLALLAHRYDRHAYALQLRRHRLDDDISLLLDMVDMDGTVALGADYESPLTKRVRRRRRRWRLWPPWRRSGPERSTPAKPTEEPVQRGRPEPDDEVSFTAGYPGVVTPHIWYSLSVYVHLSGLQAEADQRIADESRSFGMHPAASKAAAHVPLPKGTKLRISPQVPGIVFNPPAQELRWLEDLQQVAFRLQATSEAAGHAVLGAVEVHAGPLLVAQVPLSIHVHGAAKLPEPPVPIATSTGRLFSSVFASYAHEDDHVVRAVAEAYRALGIDVLVDKASLHSGQVWQQALLRLIEQADLFQLFWSEAASRSRYVAEEWEYALLLQDRKGERFIRPLHWTSPWPPPPAQLAHLHFAALDLAALSSVVSRSGH